MRIARVKFALKIAAALEKGQFKKCVIHSQNAIMEVMWREITNPLSTNCHEYIPFHLEQTTRGWLGAGGRGSVSGWLHRNYANPAQHVGQALG